MIPIYYYIELLKYSLITKIITQYEIDLTVGFKEVQNSCTNAVDEIVSKQNY